MPSILPFHCLLAAAFAWTAQAQIADVPSAIAALPSRVSETIHFQLPGDSLPGGGHLQGVQWMDGRLLLSGSSQDIAYLLTVDPSQHSSALTTLHHSPLRHAGGFQIHADRFIAVGLEDNHSKDRSRVWILDGKATPPAATTIEPLVEIHRSGAVERSTAGAIALAAQRDRHLLIVGTWDSATLDFYHSNGRPLTDDEQLEFERGDTWSAAEADRADWSDPHYGSYQNINLLRDRNDQLFLAAFCRQDAVDRLDLYELRLSKEVPVSKRLRKIRAKVFACQRSTFQAGAGLRVHADGTLSLYACSHRTGVVEVFR